MVAVWKERRAMYQEEEEKGSNSREIEPEEAVQEKGRLCRTETVPEEPIQELVVMIVEKKQVKEKGK